MVEPALILRISLLPHLRTLLPRVRPRVEVCLARCPARLKSPNHNFLVQSLTPIFSYASTLVPKSLAPRRHAIHLTHLLCLHHSDSLQMALVLPKTCAPVLSDTPPFPLPPVESLRPCTNAPSPWLPWNHLFARCPRLPRPPTRSKSASSRATFTWTSEPSGFD